MLSLLCLTWAGSRRQMLDHAVAELVSQTQPINDPFELYTPKSFVSGRGFLRCVRVTRCLCED